MSGGGPEGRGRGQPTHRFSRLLRNGDSDRVIRSSNFFLKVYKFEIFYVQRGNFQKPFKDLWFTF